MSRLEPTSAPPNAGNKERIRSRLADKLDLLSPKQGSRKPALIPAPRLASCVTSTPLPAPQPIAATPVANTKPAPAPKVQAQPSRTPLEAAPPAVMDAPQRADAGALPHMPEAVVAKLDELPAQISDDAKKSPKPARRAEKPAPTMPAADPTVASPALPMPQLGQSSGKGEIWRALEASRKAIKAVGVFSLFINLMMLAGPLFMLQVYDRVLTSGSLSTLFALTLMTIGAYAVIGMLELVRSRVITRVGTEIEQRIGDRVFEAAVLTSGKAGGAAGSALRELETLRTFIAGPAPMTAFDGLWTPIYLLVIFAVHWAIGLASVVGGAILLLCAWLTEARAREPLAEAQKAQAKSYELAEGGQRNSDALRAMGMLDAYRTKWQAVNRISLGWQMMAADKLGGMGSISKTLRLLLQSLMLAIGAGLAVHGDISAGAIIACTIIFGRALAPVEQAVAHWRGAMKARESYAKLEALLQSSPPRESRMALPRPKGVLAVSGLKVATPETRTVILTNITFDLKPGSMMAVIGPSASGKSTLAKAVVGLWPAFGGGISIDGVRLEQWNPEHLGKFIGYLPQDIELFSGTVRENISRFDDKASDEEVIEAAKAAHAHELIMAMPKGYDTDIGPYGGHLSGGQKQRVALARALFRNPPIIVLDEPNANLDRAGDEALAASMDAMRARGQAIVLVSHRVQAIGKADYLLYLDRGVQKAFGPRNDVLKFLSAENQSATQAQATQRADAAGGRK